MTKYVQPKSLTWLASALPVVLGVVKAVSLSVPEWEYVARIIDNVIGYDAAPAVLINAGLVGIGLRAALPEKK